MKSRARSVCLLRFTFAAAGTAVADDLHAAGLALLRKVRLIAALLAQRHAEQVGELEVDGLALIAQS